LKTLLRALLLSCGLIAAVLAQAQAYPCRSDKIIVPFAAGCPADNCAGFMAQRLQDAPGQSFVVDNRPGAGSVIGTDAADNRRPTLTRS